MTIVASLTQVRVLDGAQVIACHPRSFDRGQQIEVAAHIDALVAHKRAARVHRGLDRLTAAVPRSQEMLTQAAARGDNLGTLTAMLLRLLDEYGAAELTRAIDDALARGVPHPNAVRLALERRRDPSVRTHALSTYDQLTPTAEPDPEDSSS